MDLTKINEILAAESKAFKEGVQDAIDAAIDRRKDMKSEVATILGLDSGTTLTEESFFAILDGFTEISGNLDSVLQQAGFDSKVAGAWLRKEDPPKEGFRGPTLRMLAEVVFDYYADNRLYHDLHQVLEDWGDPEVLAAAAHKTLPLDSALEELGVFDDVRALDQGTRIRNCIKNEGLITLGELLSRAEIEWRRVPNFGNKSLRTLEAYLKDRFGTGFIDLENPDPDLERFQSMSWERLSLKAAAGKLLVTQWHESEKKPEYADLDYHAFQPVLREKGPEEVYVQIYADHDLMEALKEAGILHCTQLATAPQKVLDQICHGQTEWQEQLPKLLDCDRSSHYYRSLSLGMGTPLFLDPEVEVYTS